MESQLASSLSIEEDIIEELEDRERRAANLILFNLDEPQGVSCTDVTIKDIISVIHPDNVPRMKTMLGTKLQGHSRPLRISLSTKQDALEILRHK